MGKKTGFEGFCGFFAAARAKSTEPGKTGDRSSRLVTINTAHPKILKE